MLPREQGKVRKRQPLVWCWKKKRRRKCWRKAERKMLAKENSVRLCGDYYSAHNFNFKENFLFAPFTLLLRCHCETKQQVASRGENMSEYVSFIYPRERKLGKVLKNVLNLIYALRSVRKVLVPPSEPRQEWLIVPLEANAAELQCFTYFPQCSCTPALNVLLLIRKDNPLHRTYWTQHLSSREGIPSPDTHFFQ